MFNYIKGIVTSYGPNYISLENNGIGYMMIVSNPYNVKLNDDLIEVAKNNRVMVGDVKQSIYSFRGANYKNIYFYNWHL